MRGSGASSRNVQTDAAVQLLHIGRDVDGHALGHAGPLLRPSGGSPRRSEDRQSPGPAGGASPRKSNLAPFGIRGQTLHCRGRRHSTYRSMPRESISIPSNHPISAQEHARKPLSTESELRTSDGVEAPRVRHLRPPRTSRRDPHTLPAALSTRDPR